MGPISYPQVLRVQDVQAQSVRNRGFRAAAVSITLGLAQIRQSADGSTQLRAMPCRFTPAPHTQPIGCWMATDSPGSVRRPRVTRLPHTGRVPDVQTYGDRRPYAIPDTLAELTGPVSGHIVLPADWAGPDAPSTTWTTSPTPPCSTSEY